MLRAVSLAVAVSHISAGSAPVALEAGFKDRITEKIKVSVRAAADHLVKRLGSGPEGLFGGYEVAFKARVDGSADWLHKCEDLDPERDAIEACAARQLQAMAAVCQFEGYVDAHEPAKKMARAHLELLSKESIPQLGLKKMPMQGAVVWTYQKRPNNPGEIDSSPLVHASALYAMTVCANATKQDRYFEDAEAWFVGLKKMFPQSVWEASKLSFHNFAAVWESLVMVSTHVPGDSSFYDALQEYMAKLENHLWALWNKDPELWSFASARALALRWRSRELKNKKQRSKVRKWAQGHVDYFLGRRKKAFQGQGEGADMAKSILEKIGGGAGYTCGPLQGLASLATVLMDAQLIHTILKLIEKDIDNYQVSAERLGPLASIKDTKSLLGGFFRDEPQLGLEKRKSMRVDDPAQCVIAWTQALRTLDGMQGVVVDQNQAGDAEEVPAEEAPPGKTKADEL